MMMDYAEIKRYVDMHRVLESYGIEMKGKKRCACPLHGGDNKDAFSVHNDGQGWTCFTQCDCSGDIFTFIEKKEGIDNAAARVFICDRFNLGTDDKPKKNTAVKKKATEVKRTEYIYRGTDGNELFKSIRVDYDNGKKDCFQEYKGRASLPKEVRTLYNLDKIHGNIDIPIFICEGEKTADAVSSCGYIGTTNPLGSKNWQKEYADLLKGQNVVIMPDADEHGEKWRNEVLESLCGVVEQVQVINMPSSFVTENPQFTGHDFADYLQINGRIDALEFMRDSLESSKVLPSGIDSELLGRPKDVWRSIKERAKNGIDTTVFNMKEWLPSMNVRIKQGDLLVLMANTSTGKTRILHNIPFHIKRLNYAVFDLELSIDTLTLRYGAMENRLSMQGIEDKLSAGYQLNDVSVDNVFIQKVPKLTVDKIKERVELLERVTGKKIHAVAVDYIGLMSGTGSSYEITSNNVEAFKAYISATDMVGILTTQVSRPENKEEGMFKCPNPFMAKNSGSIENSAQTLIGIWKDKSFKNRLWSRVLKHTHGSAPANDIKLLAEDLLITEDETSGF